MSRPNAFRDFIVNMDYLVGCSPEETELLRVGGELVAELIILDDWLPEEYAIDRPELHQQYLLHCDPHERFSVVSIAWAPGQSTPIHDHCTWGIVGVLRGGESSQRYAFDAGGCGFGPVGDPTLATPGDVDLVSPSIGDIHRVANASPDAAAISIHVYGANIGRVRRHIYEDSGSTREFVSGYVPTPYGRLWAG